MENKFIRRIFEEEPVIIGNGSTGVLVAKRILPTMFKGMRLTNREGLADEFSCRDPYWSFELNMFPEGEMAVREAHRLYLDATSDKFWTIMSMNVFRGNFRILRNGHVEGRLEELNRKAAHNLEHAILESGRRNILKIATIGPCGNCYDPADASDLSDARRFHFYQLSCLQDFVDYFQFETFPCLVELSGALAALKDVNEIRTKRYGLEPKLAAINFVLNPDKNAGENYGGILDGMHPGNAIEQLIDEYGDLILYAGFNCTPIHAVLEGLKKVKRYNPRLMRYVKDLHINPTEKDPNCRQTIEGIHAISENELIEFYQLLEKEYPCIKIAWGCCGILPEHIKALHDYYSQKYPDHVSITS